MEDNPACANRDIGIPFVPLLAGLTLWPLLKIAGEYIVSRVNPQFFDELKLDVRKRYDLYFGTWLGSIFKVVSITACAAAVITTPAETDIMGLVRPLNQAEQWCWGCRTVIYIQEIPHITSIPELVIHHILSIVAMIAMLVFNMPRRQMYLAWGSLLSEFISNARRLIKMHGRLTPRLSWWLTTLNVAAILLFRVTSIFVALLWALNSGISSIYLIVDVGAWSIYFVYMIKVSAGELARAGLLTVDSGRPAKLIVYNKWHVDMFGIIMGLGLVLTKVLFLMVYEATAERLSSVTEIHSIAWAVLQAVAAGLVGAYITAPILRLTITTSDPGQKPSKLCLHGGFLFAAVALLSSPTMAGSVDKQALVACMAVSFPLMNAIDWVGCYYAGIGSGTTPGSIHVLATASPNEKGLHKAAQPGGIANIELPASTSSPVLSLQLIASLLAATIYLSSLAACLTGYLDLYHAAGLAVALQGIVRLNIEPRRKDVVLKVLHLPTKLVFVWADLLSFIQVGLAMGYICYLDVVASTGAQAGWNEHLHAATAVSSKYLAGLAAAYFAADGVTRLLSRTARETGTGAFVSLRALSVIVTIGLVSLIGVSVIKEGGLPHQLSTFEQASLSIPKHELWSAASSWQFVVTTLGVGILPVIATQMVKAL